MFLCACALLSVAQESVCAAPPLLGGLDRQAREEALSAVPFERLTPEARAKLEPVMKKPSIYRQLPTTVVESDPELYLFLVRYPEVIVNIWELMGVTNVTTQRTGAYSFRASDGVGTKSNVELVYGDRDTHVLYADGTYEGPLMQKPIRGQCVMVLQSQYATTEDDKTYVTNRFDMFMHFDHVGAEFLARTLHPLVGKSADHNFVETVRFVGQVAKATERKSAKLQDLIPRLTNVDPQIRQRFAHTIATVGQRAALRDAAASSVRPMPTIAPVSGTVPIRQFNISDSNDAVVPLRVGG